eukprot:jgi/Mesen1/648/ME000109S10866
MVGQTRRPNILVTGTPGTGKTSTCSLLASSTDYRHVNIGDLVKEKELHDGWDDEYECLILNEDKVKEVDKQYSHAPLCDELEDTMTAGGNVLDYHSCDLFPERWFDLVIVLQTETATLHDRLTSRGYAGKKLEENMQCEIMQVLLEEACDGYKPEIVVPLPSNNISDMENNVAYMKNWIQTKLSPAT